MINRKKTHYKKPIHEVGPHERKSNDQRVRLTCVCVRACMWVCTCLHVINSTSPVIMASFYF